VIVFDFEPNPDFDFKNVKSILKFFGKTAGVIWIDAQDKQVARLEAVLADNFRVGGLLLANMKKGAAFTIENSRVNNEIWLPSQIDLNLSVKVLLVKGININQRARYSDYRKFSTEVKEPELEDIKRN
jgi:DNA integrity scanning protein DisA with diadenylate cyclase activity